LIKVIAFDVFGTVFDLDEVDRDDVRNYIAQIRKPVWEPLRLPRSWETLPAHPDARLGIELLRSEYTVVTCSNGPLGLLAKMSKHNGIIWDAIIPLELDRVYKPNPDAYRVMCRVLDVHPSEVMMVTANESFGDLEASAALGMRPQLIRHIGKNGDGVADIVSLARVTNRPSPNIAHILQFFSYEHLPERLQEISKPFHDLAHSLAEQTNNQETSVALRKLLEAKDAAVRAAISKF